jgi:glycine oxidase
MSADVIVVGAGVVGLAVGIELARSGRSVSIYHSVSDDRFAASTAAGAMLGAFGEVTSNQLSVEAHVETEFRVESARLYEDWLCDLSNGASLGLIKCGTVVIANAFGRNDLENLNAIEATLKRFSEPYEVLERSDLGCYQPSRGYECHRALYLPNEGYLDVHKLLGLLKQVFCSYQRCQIISERVVSVSCNDNKNVTGIQLATGENVNCSCLVVAAGSNTSSILEGVSFETKMPKLIPGKGVGIELETPLVFPHVIRTPNRDFACGVHLVPRGEQKVYIGATNRTASVPGTDSGVTVEEVHDILHEAVHEIHTGLESANLVKLHCGARPLSSDSQPLLGATDIEGLFLATGTYRNGVLMAPLIAKTILKEVDGYPDKRWACMRPRSELRGKPYVERGSLFKEGAEGIVSFLPQPHGRLPYNRSQELCDVLETLFQLSLCKESELAPELVALRDELRELIDNRPMVETFAQLYYRCHEFKAGIAKRDI